MVPSGYHLGTIPVPCPHHAPTTLIPCQFGVSKTLESRWKLRGFGGSDLDWRSGGWGSVCHCWSLVLVRTWMPGRREKRPDRPGFSGQGTASEERRVGKVRTLPAASP